MLIAETTATTAPVLVVDDDADLRDLIGSILAGVGIRHCAVASGEDALRAIDAGMPRLFVLDVRMPGVSGLQLCRELKDRSGDVAILLVSAESTPEDLAAGYAAGADDYLAKPFRTSELADRVRRLLARSEAVTA